MRGHVRQVYGFSVLNLFTNPMPGPYFRRNLQMATLLGGSSLHWLIPSRQALVCFEFYECFSFTRCVNSTWRNKLPWLIIPNYHLGAIMTSSGLNPPHKCCCFFFVHHPMLWFLFIPITHLFHLLQLFRCVARRALQHRLIDCRWWVKQIWKIQPYPAGVAWDSADSECQ